MTKLTFFVFFLLIFLSFDIFSNENIGQCIHDPNALELQKKWREYLSLKQKKVKINSSILVERIRMDKETMSLLQAVSECEKLINLLDILEEKYLRKAFLDNRFNDLIASDDFIYRLENRIVDKEIKDSTLNFKNDDNFYTLLDEVRNELSKSEVKNAFVLFKQYDLGILQKKYRDSAKQALMLIRKKGKSIDEVRRWITDPPYLKNINLPSKKLGPYISVYRNLLSKSIVNFILENEVTIKDSQKIYPKMSQSEIDTLNKASPPVENNAFDENILKQEDVVTASIDGVTRTLWGEAASCEAQGLEQFMAIGKIIADRSLAVCRAIDEMNSIKEKTDEVREKNWLTILKNWAGISRPSPGLKNRPYAKLKGLNDFGRKENLELPCPAQVVSKKNQFSVWNSYSVKRFKLRKLHPNIPDVAYEIQGPQSENDDKALVRILCPQFITEGQKKMWIKAKDIATEIVSNPKNFSLKYKWPVRDEILFYTHDANLYFAKEVKVNTMILNGKKYKISKKGRGTCNNFRLFAPKFKNGY